MTFGYKNIDFVNSPKIVEPLEKAIRDIWRQPCDYSAGLKCIGLRWSGEDRTLQRRHRGGFHH